MRGTLPAPGEQVYPRKYDLLIADEAHNCAPSGAGKYATDSLRTQALRELAPHFEHKLFLTATPHNGYKESFGALLELLDNQRFSRGTEPDRKQLDAVMVRRLKSDPGFALNHLGIRRFPPRILETIEVPYTDEEKAIHSALRKYTKLRSSRAEGNGDSFVFRADRRRRSSISSNEGLGQASSWSARIQSQATYRVAQEVSKASRQMVEGASHYLHRVSSHPKLVTRGFIRRGFH